MFGPSPKQMEEMLDKFAENGQWKTEKITMNPGGKVFINQSDNSDIKPLIWFSTFLNILTLLALLFHILA